MCCAWQQKNRDGSAAWVIFSSASSELPTPFAPPDIESKGAALEEKASRQLTATLAAFSSHGFPPLIASANLERENLGCASQHPVNWLEPKLSAGGTDPLRGEGFSTGGSRRVSNCVLAVPRRGFLSSQRAYRMRGDTCGP
jgi:hypothetical protein